MSDPLADLNRLQQEDLELDRIREEQERIPDELKDARTGFKKLENQLSDLQDQLRDVRMSYHRADLEQKDLTAKRDKAKAAQSQAMNAKEQTQYGEVVRQLSDRVSELDSEILPLLEKMEVLEGQIEGVKAKVDEAKPKLDQLEADNSARVESLEAAHQEKKTARDAHATGIPANIVREYESIRKARKGTGLAKMAKAGAGYRCMACNVQLPTHVAQQVYSAGKVVRCPSCGRILWKGE